MESVKIARELIRHGAEVQPYATNNALKFVGIDSLKFATGKEVVVELTGMDEHLYEFDLILVAPSTADIISKASCGIADDAVSTLILANLHKCMFVPTMDMRMWKNPILQENIEKLKRYAKFLIPEEEEGKLKMPTRERIAAEVMHTLHSELRGKRILIIGGAGYEKIDDFRILTNLATGKTAVEISKYAYYYGAHVKLLMAGHSASIPDYIPYESFGGIQDLMNRIEEFLDYEAIIVPAALPDYRPVKVEGKIKSLQDFRNVEYEENPKLLRELRKKYQGFLVGFKAESKVSYETLIRRARERMKEYGLDMIIANLIEDVKRDTSKAVIIFSDEDFEKVEGTKEQIAKRIVEIMVDSL